jgi:hypothetical protein
MLSPARHAKRSIVPSGGAALQAGHHDCKSRKVQYEVTAGTDVPVRPGIGEAWGTTEEEARGKLRQKVDAWIAANKEGPSAD